MKKVLQIAPGFVYGGIESQLLNWYTTINQENFVFDIIKVTPPNPNELVQQVENLGGTVFSLAPLGIRTAIKHFREVKNIIDNGNYDVIHAHAKAYGFYPLKYAKKKGIKIRILHSHAAWAPAKEKNLFIKRMIGKMAMPYATHYLCCSDEAGRYAFGEKVDYRVIPNGIPIDNYKFDTDARDKMRNMLGVAGKLVIGSVGRLALGKNYSFLLDVFAEVHSQDPNTILLLVGDGPEEQNLKKKANELCLNDSVIFAGKQHDVVPYYNAMDVFVFPSVSEGFGIVAIEAQANGLPCVISSGIPQSVVVNDNVIVKQLDDSCAEWANAVLHSSVEPRIVNVNRVLDAGFDSKKVVASLMAIYTS